ncbi:MAG TPA: alpha/beta fold hydrolase [Acidobacteriota bacterium]|nr:alpha/beta fold hydrolase [Acidobacteriota bacterium]
MTDASTRRVVFESSQGLKLSGILHRPSESRGCVILSHCFTCNKNYKILVRLSRALAQAGIASLRFDFAGLGDSEGEFEETTISSDSHDLEQAVRWAVKEGMGPVVLAGHSMGGTISIVTAGRLPEVAGLAVIGTTSDPGNIYRLLPGLDPARRPPENSVDVTIAGRSYPISQEFLRDLEGLSLTGTLASYQKPFLVMHGTEDKTVGIEHGIKLFQTAKQPKSFLAIPGAEHLLGRRRDTDLAGAVLSAWADSSLRRAV